MKKQEMIEKAEGAGGIKGDQMKRLLLKIGDWGFCYYLALLKLALVPIWLPIKWAIEIQRVGKERDESQTNQHGI